MPDYDDEAVRSMQEMDEFMYFKRSMVRNHNGDFRPMTRDERRIRDLERRRVELTEAGVCPPPF